MQKPQSITQDQELAKTREYQTVAKIIQSLWDGHVIQRGTGYCLSMSDMIRTLLLQEGIRARLVECKLTVMRKVPPSLTLIGHDGLVNRGSSSDEMDVHVVCLTDSEIPMLIDLSVMGLGMGVPWICERAGDGENLGEYEIEGVRWIYQAKPQSQLPQIHQQSIVERLKTDQKIFKAQRWMMILIVTALTVSTINAVRGAYDFYSVYILENSWGPRAIKSLDERLDNIEESLKK